MLNVRIDKELEDKLDFVSKREGVSKSKIVKDALTKHLESLEPAQSSFELGRDLFGVAEGDPNLSVEFKNRLKAKLNAKHAH
jgi:metal-responsive CopG/Arc/MetJ family transcriptional regulator